MKTDPQIIRQYLERARYFALLLMGNASYIQEELRPMTMSDELREKLNALCSDLIDTKFDLFHEIFEIDELMTTSPESPTIAKGAERMQQWMLMSSHSFQESVDEVQKAVQEGTAEFLVQMLLMRCAINIVNCIPSPLELGENSDSEREGAEGNGEDEETEDEDDYDPNCYAFNSEDSYPVGLLIDTIRDLMDRPELSPETLEELRIFLFAMERLPLVTPGVRMSLGLRLDQGGESDWIEIRMEDDVFTLGRGTRIDGDADTESVFEVGVGYRDGDAFQASNFAQSFINCAEDVCREVVIDDSSDGPFTGWDLEKDKGRWGSLPCSFL